MEKLKPCPFCGSDVFIDNIYNKGLTIICKNDGCFISETSGKEYFLGSTDYLIKLWNNRV